MDRDEPQLSDPNCPEAAFPVGARGPRAPRAAYRPESPTPVREAREIRSVSSASSQGLRHRLDRLEASLHQQPSTPSRAVAPFGRRLRPYRGVDSCGRARRLAVRWPSRVDFPRSDIDGAPGDWLRAKRTDSGGREGTWGIVRSFILGQSRAFFWVHPPGGGPMAVICLGRS